ncbi:MAG: DUF4398 domain-containing protein [Calditrichaceae bacterium]|nr:DUF4398 domain-containing protein [Calditrichia bacterium]NUQ40548.1 DUF4398 domain-containing protein [Calditrichaceae bacterium]
MKARMIVVMMALSAVLVLLNSCAKMPQETVDAAKAALEAARAAEANRYVADEFNALQDTLNAAMAEIEAQNSKFALTRNYDKAKAMLESVVANAQTVAANAATAKEETRLRVQESLAQLTTLMEETKGLMGKAPRGKEGRAALEAMQDELTVVEASINEINTLVSNGDFLGAENKVNAGIAKVQSINDELKAAIAKKYGK